MEDCKQEIPMMSENEQEMSELQKETCKGDLIEDEQPMPVLEKEEQERELTDAEKQIPLLQRVLLRKDTKGCKQQVSNLPESEQKVPQSNTGVISLTVRRKCRRSRKKHANEISPSTSVKFRRSL